MDNTENGGWFIIREAECSSGEESFERMFDDETQDTDISNLIDDTEINEEGLEENHLALFNAQINEDNNRQLSDLKRKYSTPSPQARVQDLSPRLAAVTISPPKKNSKRRLFEDSGIESFNNETEDVIARSQVPVEQNGCSGGDLVVTLLKANNREAILLNKFKDNFGISFRELTRVYKSNKTCGNDWVVFVCGARDTVLEGSKSLLEQQCDFFQVTICGFMGLYLLCFKNAKCRDTILSYFAKLLNINSCQVLCDPPKNRSCPVALFFFKKSMVSDTYKFGHYPEWLRRQTMVSHQSQSETFELSKMVQWAYDNDYFEESQIAFEYALEAEVDANAAAFLKSNAQVKYVKDCAKMVRLYKKQEMKQMTMAQWIYKCCSNVTEDGDWTQIAKYLKYQEVNFLAFLGALRNLFEGTPKKHCLLIYGPPDTGKSTFCYSLVSFLKGNVVSYMNSKSHFWLMPLTECKVGYLDDATYSCFNFLDVNMRSAFDGNLVSVDCKHHVPTQVKLPPMLMTSNINIKAEQQFFYLHSRMVTFEFPKQFPFQSDGTPLFSLTHASWKSFFKKLHHQLGLPPEEELNDGESEQAFRCTAGSDNAAL
ncbi:E1 protein [Mustela putorius papillomavirus 1]|uniref:Replication protein E1 n=1 Tax=Mustela putorius papillomavirus 1 TaxID=2259540 RepID=T1YCE0_9PAPI|nr:E1 protein [Mustela putorius papillomavirus 1]AGU62951.1 E1 protein [Mustela putorius papillomavirus 1]